MLFYAFIVENPILLKIKTIALNNEILYIKVDA